MERKEVRRGILLESCVHHLHYLLQNPEESVLDEEVPIRKGEEYRNTCRFLIELMGEMIAGNHHLHDMQVEGHPLKDYTQNQIDAMVSVWEKGMAGDLDHAWNDDGVPYDCHIAAYLYALLRREQSAGVWDAQALYGDLAVEGAYRRLKRNYETSDHETDDYED